MMILSLLSTIYLSNHSSHPEVLKKAPVVEAVQAPVAEAVDQAPEVAEEVNPQADRVEKLQIRRCLQQHQQHREQALRTGLHQQTEHGRLRTAQDR